MWAEEPETPEDWMMRKERFYGSMRDEFYGKHAGIKQSIMLAVATGVSLKEVAREWEVSVDEVERQCRWMIRRMSGEVDPPTSSVVAQAPDAYGAAAARKRSREWREARARIARDYPAPPAPNRTAIPRKMSEEEIRRAFA